MGETSHTSQNQERKQKTLDERDAQIKRITDKLIERAVALPSDKSDRAEILQVSVQEDSTVAGFKHRAEDGIYVQTRREDGGEDVVTVKTSNGSTFIEKMKQDKDQRTKGGVNLKRLEFLSKEDSLSSRYEEVEDGVVVDERMLTDKQAESAVAKSLMEARGAIAAHEIAKKQDTADKVDEMF